MCLPIQHAERLTSLLCVNQTALTRGDTLAIVTGSNPPAPEDLMAVSREVSVQRRKTRGNLIRNPKDRFSGELKGERCRTRTIKKRQAAFVVD